MTTPTKRTRSGRGRTAAEAARGTRARKATRPASEAGRGRAAGGTSTRERAQDEAQHPHDITVTIPVDRAADTAKKAVALPVATARRVLPAKGGLPLYAGLGALGVAGVLEWPVAVGIGIGYAVLRRGGPLEPRPEEDGDS